MLLYNRCTQKPRTSGGRDQHCGRRRASVKQTSFILKTDILPGRPVFDTVGILEEGSERRLKVDSRKDFFLNTQKHVQQSSSGQLAIGLCYREGGFWFYS